MQKRIVVLDDNQDILDIVHEVLSYEKFDVHSTSETSELYQLIDTYNPDLIILDYKLMDGNGADICLSLKSQESSRHIPVIIFSAYIGNDVDFAHYGCDAVIPKPFDLPELIDTVNSVISKARQVS